MEVVAAVASVTGIFSLAGELLSGLSTLYSFFKDCRNASKTADRFLRALASLESTIKDVKNLMDSVKYISDTQAESNLASLGIHLEDCQKDVERWLREARSCHPGEGPWTKSIFKKFLVTIKRHSIKDIFQEVAAHKDSISLTLATTGRFLDIQQLNKADALYSKVGEIVEYQKVTVEAVGRLEARYQQSSSVEYKALNPSCSLSSLASQLSRIESLLSSGSVSASGCDVPQSPNRRRFQIQGSTPSLYGTDSTSEEHGRSLLESAKPIKMQADNTKLEAISEHFDPGLGHIGFENEFLPCQLSDSHKHSEKSVALDFFHAFTGFIAHAGELTTKSVMEYIRYYQISETTKTQIRILSTLAPYLNIQELSTADKYLQGIQANPREYLKSIEATRDTYREACWREGYDVDALDHMLDASRVQCIVPGMDAGSFIGKRSEQGQIGWWDVLRHVGPQNWLNKKDRINSWLLQNLAAQPNEALQHRKYLIDGLGDKLSEEEWARLVLKFWTLDGAAQPLKDFDCSTNGAVDSNGVCHSARVEIQFVPLPTWNGLDAIDVTGDSYSQSSMHSSDWDYPEIQWTNGIAAEDAENDDAESDDGDILQDLDGLVMPEYHRFPILLQKPDNKNDEEVSRSLLTDFNTTDVNDRITMWLLHKLRSSSIEVELLLQISQLNTVAIDDSGLNPLFNPTDKWQEEVLEFWFIDESNLPRSAHIMESTADLTELPADLIDETILPPSAYIAEPAADSTLLPAGLIKQDLLPSPFADRDNSNLTHATGAHLVQLAVKTSNLFVKSEFGLFLQLGSLKRKSALSI